MFEVTWAWLGARPAEILSKSQIIALVALYVVKQYVRMFKFLYNEYE